MAKKKKTTIEKELVSPTPIAKAYNILSDEDEQRREMILDLRAKGFDTNRIAARLEIQKSIVENILNSK